MFTRRYRVLLSRSHATRCIRAHARTLPSLAVASASAWSLPLASRHALTTPRRSTLIKVDNQLMRDENSTAPVLGFTSTRLFGRDTRLARARATRVTRAFNTRSEMQQQQPRYTLVESRESKNVEKTCRVGRQHVFRIEREKIDGARSNDLSNYQTLWPCRKGSSFNKVEACARIGATLRRESEFVYRHWRNRQTTNGRRA